MENDSDYEIARVLAEEFTIEGPCTSSTQGENEAIPSQDKTLFWNLDGWWSQFHPMNSLGEAWEYVANSFTPLTSLLPGPQINFQQDEEENLTSRADLEEKLKLYGMKEKVIDGDGNCQFSSISDQLYSSPSHHYEIRKLVVEQLTQHPEIYASYVSGDYVQYIEKMKEDGQWGDYVTLKAAADSIGVKIYVLSSFRDESFIQVEPAELKSQRCLYLSFWAEVHYNSIYPADECLPEERRLWNPLTMFFHYSMHRNL